MKKKLGKGAQGSVFLVEDKFTNEMCVVKKVNHETVDSMIVECGESKVISHK